MIIERPTTLNEEQNKIVDHFVSMVVKSFEIWQLKQAHMHTIYSGVPKLDIDKEIISDLKEAKVDLFDMMYSLLEMLEDDCSRPNAVSGETDDPMVGI